MKHAVPIFDGTTPISPIDPAGERIYDGVKKGAFAGVHHELGQQVKAFEKTLPPSPKRSAVRRNRAALTDAERRFISPHAYSASGARNSAADLKLIQSAHDAVVHLGAACTETTDNSENFVQ